MSEGNVPRTEILPLLNGLEPRKSGGWVQFHCPVPTHGQGRGDRDRSAALSDAGVLKCFAGCEFRDLLAALRDRAGISRSGGDRQKQRTERGWPKTPVRAYEYIDPATGLTLAVKGRFERPDPEGGKPEKTFFWRLPDGEYQRGLEGRYTMRDMPLWGAELLADVPPETRIWFTEGEKAAEALRARNEVAVCGAWSGSQRDFGEALNVLAGRPVILWPDNDPTGRDYMVEIRRALRGIARSVAVVNAPVPPGGDAVEFFQAGGQLDALLANTLDRPTVDVMAGNHLVVRVPSDEGPIRFDFDRILRSSGAMDCELTVEHMNPVAEREPYATRINLLSASARSQLETALGKQFGRDVNWTTLVSIAFSRVRQAHNELDRTAQVATLPDMEVPEFLVEDLLPMDSDTIIFGDGASGKTFIAYAIALEVATGGAFCGLRVRPGGVLILDYETGPRMVKFRLRRLLAGMGLDPAILPELPIYYVHADAPLPELVDTLRQAIARHDIRLLVVDAAADACGGEPEKAGVVLNYFNASSALAVTRLHIAHVTNSEMEVSAKRPFGSRYWHNRARRTWFVRRDQEEDSDDVDVGFICRKVSDGRFPKPKAFHLRFTGDSGPVYVTRADFRDVVAFEKDQPIADRVASFLARQSGSVTIATIADAEDLPVAAVKTALYRGRGKRFVCFPAGSGRGIQAEWGLLAQEESAS